MYHKKTTTQANNTNVRKPPQTRNSDARERVTSANKQRDNQTQAYWFKQKDQQLLNLVKEYLQKNGFTRTFQILRNEKPIRRLHNNNSRVQTQQTKPSNLLTLFDKGSRQQFFKNSIKIFNTNDNDLKKLQFQLHIYFCIYSIHPSVKKATSIDKNSLEAFKKYLETKGADFSKTNQFLSFYALPYIPKPQQYPSLAHVFTKDWVLKLRAKLQSIIPSQKPVVQNQQLKRYSALQQLYYNCQTNNQSSSSKQQFCKQNCKHILEAQQAIKHNKQLISYIDILNHHFKEFTEVSKNNLLQSNAKWFHFAKQMFMLVKKVQRGQKVHNLEKYETLFSKSVQQLVYGTNDISIFERNSYTTQQISINPNALIKKNDKDLICQVDLNKIYQLFLEPYKQEKQIMLCMVLKALRNRFMKIRNPYIRRQIIIAYSRHDICGINTSNNKIQKNLLLESSQRVKQYYLRLLNYITTDFYGITYLSSSEKLIQNIIGIFGIQPEYSVSRKCSLGILQRMSLLKKAQGLMISFGIIPMIFRIFRNQKEQISSYSRQYLTAMIMNLSLRKSSKAHFEKNKVQLITLLLNLTDCEDPMVKDYVNGALYSLIQVSTIIKHEAIRQQGIERISQLIANCQTNAQYEQEEEDNIDKMTLIRQYQYIIDALKGQNTAEEGGELSDSEQEDVQMDDIDDHQEDEVISMSSDQEEYLQGQDQYFSGDQLLMKQFPLLGPQAIREQMLTRSVLDETSKKIHNMTASINKSRRIDNIFAQQRPVTPSLLPQLQKAINQKL